MRLNPYRPYLVLSGIIASFLITLLPYLPEVIAGFKVYFHDLLYSPNAIDIAYFGLAWLPWLLGLEIVLRILAPTSKLSQQLQTWFAHVHCLFLLFIAPAFWIAVFNGVPPHESLSLPKFETIYGCLITSLILTGIAYRYCSLHLPKRTRLYHMTGIFSLGMIASLYAVSALATFFF